MIALVLVAYSGIVEGHDWGETGMGTSERAQDSNPLSISTISEDLVINGNVTSKSELHLEGQFRATSIASLLYLGRLRRLKVTWLRRRSWSVAVLSARSAR